jgi:hypothetical protein
MDVGRRVFGAIDLHYPVDGGEVDTSCTDVRAEHDSVFLLYELEVYGRSLVLVHLSVELEQVLANFECFERLVCKAHLLTGGEKYEDFLLLMQFEETEKHVKLFINFHFHVVMQQSQRSDLLQGARVIIIFIDCRAIRSALHRVKTVNLNVFSILGIEVETGEFTR